MCDSTWGFLWNFAVRNSNRGIRLSTNRASSRSCQLLKLPSFSPFWPFEGYVPPFKCFNNFLDNCCFFFKRFANSLPYLATFTAYHFDQGSQGNEPRNVAPGN